MKGFGEMARKFSEDRNFGEFVKALRKGRLFFDGELRQWTQEYLAKKASEASEGSNQIITPSQIAHLEQGQISNIRPFLDPLAKAFNLNEAEKEHFYAIAGFIYRSERQPLRQEIEELFQDVEYPAFARTPLWDFVAFNKYNYALWGYTPEKLARLKRLPLGPNILKVLIDPVFESRKYKGGQERWLSDVGRSIQAFRFESFRYAGTKRFREIIDAMYRYPAFANHWNTAEASLNDQDINPTRPISRIEHPEFGLLEFLSLRTPTKYLGSSVDISIYVPLTSSIDRYRDFRDRTKERNDIEPIYSFELDYAAYELSH